MLKEFRKASSASEATGMFLLSPDIKSLNCQEVDQPDSANLIPKIYFNR